MGDRSVQSATQGLAEMHDLITKIGHSLKTQSLGLSMIVATLCAIALVVYQSLSHQHRVEAQNVRAQGQSLAQLLSEVPASQLTAQNTRNTLSILQHSLPRNVLAYAVVVNANGRAVSQVNRQGVVVPPGSVAASPSEWNGERQLKLVDGRDIREFYAPVLVGSSFRGAVRLGFFEPEFIAGWQNLPMIASMALPVFLLAPLFYFLMRRQLLPLQQTQQKIASQLDAAAGRELKVDVNGELGEFLTNFNDYFRRASERINLLEHDNHSVQASSKVLHYKYSRLEAVIEALPNGVLLFDESGSLVFANNKISSLIAVEKTALLEQAVANWCPNDEMFQYLARCSDPSNRALPELRTRVEGNGRVKDLNLAAYPMLTDSGQSQGNLVIVRDASKEIAAESSREEFVAHISHELKTPLNTLMLYSESLLGEDGRDEQFRSEGLNVIYDEAERMAALISNLLSITKIEMGSLNIERTRVKFNDFIEDTFRTIEKGAHASGLQFDLQLPGDEPLVAIDKDLMRVAVNNLLTNAVKYNRPNGKVSLEVEDLDDSVRLQVRDTGIGISAADLEHVFDKFYRSESDEVRERTGHGLGLSLAHDIVQLHNGRLSVSSEPGVGTEFIIELRKESELLRKAS